VVGNERNAEKWTSKAVSHQWVGHGYREGGKPAGLEGHAQHLCDEGWSLTKSNNYDFNLSRLGEIEVAGPIPVVSG